MSEMGHCGVTIAVEQGDAMTFVADVLALRHGQGLYGVEGVIATRLSESGEDIERSLPRPGEFWLFPAIRQLGVNSVLFVGVDSLLHFDYAGVRDFGRRVLSSLAGAAPQTRHVCVTLLGRALDESEAFKAEIAGILDALASGEAPRFLERVTIIERDTRRAERLSRLLSEIMSDQSAATANRESPVGATHVAREVLRDVGQKSREKAHVFVAMPFALEFDDHFHYGIQGAVHAEGLLCERADLASFTGDVIAWVKERIATATLLIADLSAANPNVYLEVGFAWGQGIPTVLLARDASELKFDVRGQRCLIYNNSIRRLEEPLRQELTGLGVKPTSK